MIPKPQGVPCSCHGGSCPSQAEPKMGSSHKHQDEEASRDVSNMLPSGQSRHCGAAGNCAPQKHLGQQMLHHTPHSFWEAGFKCSGCGRAARWDGDAQSIGIIPDSHRNQFTAISSVRGEHTYPNHGAHLSLTSSSQHPLCGSAPLCHPFCCFPHFKHELLGKAGEGWDTLKLLWNTLKLLWEGTWAMRGVEKNKKRKCLLNSNKTT